MTTDNGAKKAYADIEKLFNPGDSDFGSIGAKGVDDLAAVAAVASASGKTVKSTRADNNRLASENVDNNIKKLKSAKNNEAESNSSSVGAPASVKSDKAISQADAVKAASQIEDNILNDFENHAYNLKVFLARETANVASLPNEDIIVLAETGGTATFSIEECTMNNIISPNFRTRNTIVTSVDLKIVEPLGSTFFDRIRIAAQSLGIKDHVRAPWWLEVSFKGYNGPGDESHTGGDDIIRTESRLYKLTVTGTHAEVTAGGTSYDVKLAPTSEVAMRDQFRRLDTNVNVDANTVGEFFDKLSKILTGPKKYTIENLTKNNWPAFNNVSFNMPTPPNIGSDMRKWELRGDDDFIAVRSASWLEREKREQQDSKVKVFVENDITKVSFHKGTSIEAIVEQVLSSTVEGQSWAILGKPVGSEDLANYTKARDPNKPAAIFMVDPTMDIISYNNVAKEYNTDIVYNIRAFLTFQTMASPDQVAIAEDDPNRLASIMKVCNVKKRYEYIYTGLNTEILDFKLSFDRAWFVQLPIFGGFDNEGQATGTKRSSNDLKDKQAGNNSQKINQNNQVKSKDAIATVNPTDESNNTTKTTKMPTAEQQSALDRLNSTDIARTGVQQGSAPARANTNFFGASNTLTTTNDLTRFTKNSNGRIPSSQPVVNPNASKANRGTIFYAEDLDIISVGRVQKNGPKTSDPNAEVRGILKAHVAAVESADQSNIESTGGKGRSFFSAILNQAYGSMSDLISVTMEIRGDPYWLGEPNIEERLANVDRDLTSSQSLFLFTMAFPTSPDDIGSAGTNIDSSSGTGLVSINREQNGFNGIYQVRQVKSTFSGGKFTQRLDAFIDPMTKEQEIIQMVNTISPPNKT